MKYHEQLKHPLWQKKRLEVLEYRDFQCQECESKEDTLHVHHPFYKRGAMIWDYENDELQCLCEKCHIEAHSLDERLKISMSYLDSSSKKRLLGFSASLSMPPQELDDDDYMLGYSDGIRTNSKALIHMLRKCWGK